MDTVVSIGFMTIVILLMAVFAVTWGMALWMLIKIIAKPYKSDIKL